MDVSLLQKTPFYEGIKDKGMLEEFASLFHKRDCDAELKDGSLLLIKEGEIQSKAFFFESGSGRKLKLVPGPDPVPQKVTISSVGPGDLVGFNHLFQLDPAYADLEVSEPGTVVWQVNAEEFQTFVGSHPKFAHEWINMLTREVRQQSKIIRALSASSGSSKEDTRMRIAFFDANDWTIKAFSAAAPEGESDWHKEYSLTFFQQKLDSSSVNLAVNFDVVCCFVNDVLDKNVLMVLSQLGVKMVAMRCAGFDRVDIASAQAFGMTVARVPAYSPYAVAEHAIGMMLTLNRKLHRAYNRTRDGNFELEGLLGFDCFGKTAGVIGTGKIGRCVVDILLGFGCKVLCFDIYPAAELQNRPNVTYVSLDELYAHSDLVFLHAPLTKETFHMINDDAIHKMKDGVLFVNTSRGGLVDTRSLLEGLKSKKVRAAGLDVYEGESEYFFGDCSNTGISDPVLRELLSMNNVLVTGHQAFFTQEALQNIVSTTMRNVQLWRSGKLGHSHPNSIF